MQIFLIVYASILIFISILIIISILLQEDKSGGSIGMIGGSSQSFFGTSSGTILSKFTSILLVIFLLSTIIIAIVSSKYTSEAMATKEDITKTEFSEFEAKKTTIDINKDLLNKETTSDIK